MLAHSSWALMYSTVSALVGRREGGVVGGRCWCVRWVGGWVQGETQSYLLISLEQRQGSMQGLSKLASAHPCCQLQRSHLRQAHPPAFPCRPRRPTPPHLLNTSLLAHNHRPTTQPTHPSSPPPTRSHPSPACSAPPSRTAPPAPQASPAAGRGSRLRRPARHSGKPAGCRHGQGCRDVRACAGRRG